MGSVRGGVAARRGTVVVACACFVVGGVFEACGLDESGLAGDAGVDVTALDANEGGANDVVTSDVVASDVVTNDVVADVVNDAPPACATTDVSCFGLDGGLPDGWAPYVFVPSGGACPSGDFQRTTAEANPRLDAGCACASCTGQGSWACNAQLQFATGHTGCGGGNQTVGSGGCSLAAATDDRTIQLSNANVSATANGLACEAGSPTPAVADWDTVALCQAGCDAGAAAVCGQTAAATRCVVADGDQACPGTLAKTLIGGGASVTCAACTCTVNTTPPTCKAVAQIYTGTTPNLTCSGTPAETFDLDGTCQTTNGNINSYSASWSDAGAPTCNPSGGGADDAGLSSVRTVCCTN